MKVFFLNRKDIRRKEENKTEWTGKKIVKRRQKEKALFHDFGIEEENQAVDDLEDLMEYLEGTEDDEAKHC